MDPRDVDIMMGTFTKSFGSCGGYIAAERCQLLTSLPSALNFLSQGDKGVEEWNAMRR